MVDPNRGINEDHDANFLVQAGRGFRADSPVGFSIEQKTGFGNSVFVLRIRPNQVTMIGALRGRTTEASTISLNLILLLESKKAFRTPLREKSFQVHAFDVDQSVPQHIHCRLTLLQDNVADQRLIGALSDFMSTKHTSL